MTTLIWAVDGLDADYVHERKLMEALEPKKLHQDLEGANGLFTYRVWPAIWTGENGGYHETEESYRFVPDSAPIWATYSTTAALIPWHDGHIFRNQNVFDPNYRESAGPRERIHDQRVKYWDVFHAAVDSYADVLMLGTKIPDILGHLDNNAERIDEILYTYSLMVEKMCIHPEIDDYLVISDHGFKYNKFGEKPSGVDAHSRRATLASSFADDYDFMSNFITGWTDDLDETLRKQQLDDLGYA